MAEPQLLAVLIVIAFFFITLFGGGYLIYRTMNRPDAYIGARMHANERRLLEEERRLLEEERRLLEEERRLLEEERRRTEAGGSAAGESAAEESYDGGSDTSEQPDHGERGSDDPQK
ncbi:hypothetical protein [Brevibacterium otitidis]|uniref:Uncharacterized protein n=1 Tax=Brevibacterium otitidis TaxID=53364 RepID=A0ABV5WZ19_9MICO|nr:hypothetical protein GCM10023233_26450 [Brevibacterium otitidis]